MDRENRVLVASQEFLLEDFDSRIVLSVQFLAQVDLAGVSLAEGLEDLVLTIENGVGLVCVCLS